MSNANGHRQEAADRAAAAPEGDGDSNSDPTGAPTRDLPPRAAVERFLARRQEDNADSTIRSYTNRLQTFVEWAEERGLDSMADLDGWLIDEYAHALKASDNATVTAKGKLMVLKQLLKYCATLDVVDPELAESVEIPSLSREEESDDTMLEAPEAFALLDYFRNSTRVRGTCRHLALELMFHIGGRISCFRALDLDDWYPDDRILKFRNRPPTRLKDGVKHERNVLVTEEVADVIDFWIARERPQKRDDEGRKPLLSTYRGRASSATIQTWAYQATLPCLHGPCPHGRERESCEWTHRDSASKCPSSRSPHAIRTGSITWQLNNGLDYVTVAKRVAATPETIRRYYDKPDHEAELERRRPMTENLDISRSEF
jgi:site-specific recombinase XerD